MVYRLYTKPQPGETVGQKDNYVEFENENQLADLVNIEVVDVLAAIELAGWCGCYVPGWPGIGTPCVVVDASGPLNTAAILYLNQKGN